MEEAWRQATRTINRKAAEVPPAQYKPRDQVWLEVTHLKLPHQGSKLNPKQYGPFKILDAISPVAFKLDLPVSWTIHPVFHASLLTPYVKTNTYGPNYSQPPPDLIDDEEQYKVEQIRNHQYHRQSRTLQYLIKWWGYPESDNTWEPADQVYALDLLWEYHKYQPLESIKGKQNPPAKTAIHTITSSKLPTIASQWPSPLPCSQSSSPATLNMSQLSSPTSLSTPPHTPTPYPPTRSPSLGPSTISRPMPSGTGPSHHTLFRTSCRTQELHPHLAVSPHCRPCHHPTTEGGDLQQQGQPLQAASCRHQHWMQHSQTVHPRHWWWAATMPQWIWGQQWEAPHLHCPQPGWGEPCYLHQTAGQQHSGRT